MVSVDWHGCDLPEDDLSGLALLEFAREIAGEVASLFVLYWDEGGKGSGASILMRILPSETGDVLRHIRRTATKLSAAHGAVVETGEHRWLRTLATTEEWPRVLRPVKNEGTDHVLRFGIR
jgi:hypothetical protein